MPTLFDVADDVSTLQSPGASEHGARLLEAAVMPMLKLADTLKLPIDDEPRYGTTTRWKGKRLLTKAEKLERQRALTRKWRAKNREKQRAYFAAYRAAHPELKLSAADYYRQLDSRSPSTSRRPRAVSSITWDHSGRSG